MNEPIKKLRDSKKFNSYIEEIKNINSPVVSLTGLTDVLKTYFAYFFKK